MVEPTGLGRYRDGLPTLMLCALIFCGLYASWRHGPTLEPCQDTSYLMGHEHMTEATCPPGTAAFPQPVGQGLLLICRCPQADQ